ncbi:cupin domain-containing protein [Roseofilum sp. Guam]|uniref:cupin domain-containing protein n=1 Tax=Roseofilum sp. Guam TaxID=2821502 RepID=UPI001B1FFBA0|nr:cupin domain-containing protein [Roseofilum sp. Guam]MBP0030055.1 cupin domain-containing protein [Roseofilum sp. Guam]
MSPKDQNQVCIDTNQASWQPGEVSGLQMMPLRCFHTEQVFLMKWEALTHYPHYTHSSSSEVLVLDGVWEDEYGKYPKGTWLRSPVGSSHSPFSQEGCLLYAKTGHLPA